MGVLTLTMHGSVEAMLRYRLDTALRIFLNCHAERAEALYATERSRLDLLIQCATTDW